jgi:hypothetical protein
MVTAQLVLHCVPPPAFDRRPRSDACASVAFAPLGAGGLPLRCGGGVRVGCRTGSCLCAPVLAGLAAGNADLKLGAKPSGSASSDADVLEVRATLQQLASRKSSPVVCVACRSLHRTRSTMLRAGRGSPVDSILKGPEGRRSLAKRSVQRLQAAKYDYSIIV